MSKMRARRVSRSRVRICSFSMRTSFRSFTWLLFRGCSGMYIPYSPLWGSHAMLNGPIAIPSNLPWKVVDMYAPYSCSFSSASMPLSFKWRWASWKESTADRRRRLALHEHGVDDRLAVDRVGDGAAHPHVAEGRLVGAHVDAGRHVGHEVLVEEAGLGLAERLQVVLPDGPPVPRAAVDLSGAIGGQPRGLVLHDEPLDAVDRRQPRLEVVRVPLEDRLHAGLVAVED